MSELDVAARTIVDVRFTLPEEPRGPLAVPTTPMVNPTAVTVEDCR